MLTINMGGDARIATKAYAMAIIADQALPDDRQEKADTARMCQILRTMGPQIAPAVVSAEMQTGRVIDLFADREDYSSAEREAAQALWSTIAEHRVSQWRIRRKALALDDALAINHPPHGHDDIDGIAELPADIAH